MVNPAELKIRTSTWHCIQKSTTSKTFKNAISTHAQFKHNRIQQKYIDYNCRSVTCFYLTRCECKRFMVGPVVRGTVFQQYGTMIMISLRGWSGDVTMIILLSYYVY